MNKLNCWDYMKCDREPGGMKVDELGLCPVADKSSADGFNGGVNGGRICWIVTDTCSGHKSKSFCSKCEFRSKIVEEEGLLKYINSHV